MDPLSVTASTLTIIVFLGESCQFITSLLRSASDAPGEIRNHCTLLQALHASFRRVHVLCADTGLKLRLSPEFLGHLEGWLVDFQDVEAKLRSSERNYHGGKRTRTWARIRWAFSSEHWLGKFLIRVQRYHQVISLELMIILTDLNLISSRTLSVFMSPKLLQRSTAAYTPISLRPDNIALPPSIAMTTVEVDGTTETPRVQLRAPAQGRTVRKARTNCTQAEQYTSLTDRPAGPTVKSTSLQRFLQTYAEPHSIRIQRAFLYETSLLSFAVRCGPPVMKQFSLDQNEIYKVSSSCRYSFSIMIQLPWRFLGRMVLTLFASQELTRLRGLSLQWNISFPRVIPSSAPIIELTRTGDIIGMENLFSAGVASPADVSSDGISLLHIAAQANNFELVECLLNKGVDANTANDEGETALHIAIAQSRDYNISRLLIEKGGDLSNRNIHGSTPLHTFFNKIVRRLLVCHGEDLETKIRNETNRLILHYIAWSNKSTVEDAKRVLSDPLYLTMRDDQDRTPLHYAALRGNVKLARYFIAQTPNHLKGQADCNGRSAFHYAVESKRTEIIQIMEKGGLNIYKKDSQRRGVLHQAARFNNLEAVKKVIAAAGEQELEAEDINGRTPLRLAEDCGAHQVADYLRVTYGVLPGMAEEAKQACSTWKAKWPSSEPLHGSKESIDLSLNWAERKFLLTADPSGFVLLIMMFILIGLCGAP